jgi:hypothetical protein
MSMPAKSASRAVMNFSLEETFNPKPNRCGNLALLGLQIQKDLIFTSIHTYIMAVEEEWLPCGE